MQMRGPAAIGHRPDGLEGKPSVGIGGADPETLEIVVARQAVVAGVVVAAMDVALPQFDGDSLRRRTVDAEDAAGLVLLLTGCEGVIVGPRAETPAPARTSAASSIPLIVRSRLTDTPRTRAMSSMRSPKRTMYGSSFSPR